MNYKEYVEQLDDDELQLIAAEHGFEAQPSALSAIRNRLIRILEDADNLEKSYRKLPQEAQKLLEAVVATGNHLLDQEARRLLGGGKKAGEILHQLAASGFLLPFYEGHQQNIFYSLPEEVESFLSKKIAKSNSIDAVEEVHAYGLGLQGFLQDMLTYLSYLHSQKVKITRQHELFKRNREQLSALLLADRFELVEYGCRLMGLVRYQGEYAQVQVNNLEDFLAMDRAEQIQVLYQIGRMGCIGTGSGSWERQSLSTFEKQFTESYPRWTNFSEFLQGLGNERTHYLETNQMNHYLGLFFAMGFIEQGITKDKIYCFRLTSEGAFALKCSSSMPSLQDEFTLYIQPNYEVLFPYTLPLTLRWKLSSFTVLEKADPMMTAKLTRQSLIHGLEMGNSLEKILDFLHDNCAMGIPQNVEYSLREWTEKHGQVYLMDALILRVKHPELAQELKNIKGIAENILGEITPVDWIVKRKAAKSILTLLEKKGYGPLQEIQRPGMDTPEEEESYQQRLQHSPAKLLKEYENWTEYRQPLRNNIFLLPLKDVLLTYRPGEQQSKEQKGRMLFHPAPLKIHEIMEKAIGRQQGLDILYYERTFGRTSEIFIEPFKMVYDGSYGWSVRCRILPEHDIRLIHLRDIVGIRDL